MFGKSTRPLNTGSTSSGASPLSYNSEIGRIIDVPHIKIAAVFWPSVIIYCFFIEFRTKFLVRLR